jgi:NifU-like protein involved in Fe-S cluster formation
MVWEYTEKTKKLFMDAVHGKPGTHMGEIENPDGLGEHGSIACGDALRFTFRVRRHPSDPTQDVITEARYLTFGCTSAIAASEALCMIIEENDCTPIQALEIKNQDIVDYLDGLPEAKIHCSVMGAEALQAAIFNWAQKRDASSASASASASRTSGARSRSSSWAPLRTSPARSRPAAPACRVTISPAACRISSMTHGARRRPS